jgi:general secretion pathway protein K
MLPQKTAVNVNTAPREVLAAVLNISMADADRITQMRVPNALTLGNLQSQFPGLPPPNGAPATGTQGSTPQQPGQQQGSSTPLYGITTSYFYVQGQIRLGDRVVQERSLVQVGRGARPVVLQRDWISGVTSSS